jgi:hypothetical protein
MDLTHDLVQRWGLVLVVLNFRVPLPESYLVSCRSSYPSSSRTVLGPTQPPIQWERGVLSLGVKRPGCEADHSHPSRAEVKEWVELHIHSPNTPSWRSGQLKHKDNFTLPYRSSTSLRVYHACSEYGRFRPAIPTEGLRYWDQDVPQLWQYLTFDSWSHDTKHHPTLVILSTR